MIKKLLNLWPLSRKYPDGYTEQSTKENHPSINMVKYDQDNEWYLKTPPSAGYKERLKP